MPSTLEKALALLTRLPNDPLIASALLNLATTPEDPTPYQQNLIEFIDRQYEHLTALGLDN